jgi:hypothetical protein
LPKIRWCNQTLRSVAVWKRLMRMFWFNCAAILEHRPSRERGKAGWNLLRLECSIIIMRLGYEFGYSWDNLHHTSYLYNIMGNTPM